MSNIREPSETLIAKIRACTPYLNKVADMTLDELEQRKGEYMNEGIKVRDAIFQGIEEGFTTEEILRMIVSTTSEIRP
jgi:hypothetical protein